MGYLERFARKKYAKKTESLSVRVPEDLYNSFRDYCDELGLSVSEAVNLLIEREVTESNAKNYKRSANDEIATTSEVQEPSSVLHHHAKPLTSSYKPVERKATMNTNGRFTYKSWEVEHFLPCPLCKDWVSSSNFSRHAKQHHDLTTQEIFTEFKDIADEMYAKRKPSP
jgi:antitoxin component of RelBE/YafQ-DinJ toxin-antitoxin module